MTIQNINGLYVATISLDNVIIVSQASTFNKAFSGAIAEFKFIKRIK